MSDTPPTDREADAAAHAGREPRQGRRRRSTMPSARSATPGAKAFPPRSTPAARCAAC
ncbi:hypothetical protein [Lysobacter gummosus]|uniref:hypothetical protein n=1 Tax=Lysobacter gummosus TaxID=262324 RepID=UPI0036261299